MRVGLLAVIELSLDLLGQDLAELDTPLVEAVDVPDSTLGEGEVLVVDDQSTKSGRCDLVSQDGGGGAVAQEGLVRDKVVGSTLSLDLVGGLADHKSLSLSEEVRSQHLLVLVVLDGVVALSSQDEVGGDELGALVEQLVERVLGVGRGLTEQDGSSGVLDVITAAGDSLAIGLHRQLLEVGREPVEVLVEAAEC